MALTVNKYRTATRERVATIRLTLNLTADELAAALADHHGLTFGFDDTVEVDYSDDNIREALLALFHSGLETVSYRVGDNKAEDAVAVVHEGIVNRVFNGREHVGA